MKYISFVDCCCTEMCVVTPLHDNTIFAILIIVITVIIRQGSEPSLPSVVTSFRVRLAVGSKTYNSNIQQVANTQILSKTLNVSNG